MELLSLSLFIAIWYAFIRSMVWIHQMWFHGYQNIDSDQSRYDWVSRYGPSSSSSSFVNLFLFIGNWCVFFLLFTLLLRRFSSIHSMCFSSICIWHADQIDSINNFIFSTEKNVRSHRILFVKWCEYQSTMEISTKKFYSLISRSLHITVFAVCICIYACNDNRKI